MNIRYILALTIMLLVGTQSLAQIPTEDEARSTLVERGIDEAELRQELLKQGIDLDNIATTDPAELQRTQQIIEETMDRLEANAEKEISGTPVDGTEKSKVLIAEQVDIKEAVEDGATIEEAISEELQEEAKEILPDALVYGHHIFRNNSVKFYRKSEDAKPPSTYIIGPGDKISVAIWGQAELNYSQEVSRDGFIKPDRVSRIYLAGLTIAEARTAIKRKLSKFYPFTDNTFEVNVVTARTINVNITGEVFNVGSYSVSALNSAFNALVAAGGPSDIGSVRNIKIASTTGGTKTLDVYKFLTNPLIAQDFYLFENDYIIVPVAERVVEIKGAINRPFKYELIKSENLNELLAYAGGLKANALKRSIKITRVANDEETIINVNLNDLERRGGNFDLYNGDVIEVVEIPKKYENIVAIEGSVELPGEYAFKPNMRVSDLLSAAKVEDDAILSTAFLMRLNDDQKTVRYEIIDISSILGNTASPQNLLLRRGDVLTVRSKSSFVDKKVIEVSGAVRIQNSYPYSGGNMRVSDAVFLSGGLTENATDFAFIFRDKGGRSDTEYISVDLAAALEGDLEKDIELEAGDKLVVYNRNSFIDDSFVSVKGSVREPKEIRYDTTLDVKKALLLAGGLTFDASLKQIDIFRLDFSADKKTRTLAASISLDEELNVVSGLSKFSLQPFDQIVVRKAPEFELQRNVTVSGEVKYPGSYALVSDNTRISEILQQAGGVTDEAFLKGATLLRNLDDVGYVIIDLEKALNNKEKTFDAILQAGDVLDIPKLNELVTVSGAVHATSVFKSEIASTGRYSFVYEPGKNAKYYIDKYAGGVSKDGKASRITVSYPNGEVKQTSKFLFWNNYPKVEPGSSIYVGFKDPEKVNQDGEKEPIDWSQILSDSVAQATTILTLVLLINRID